MEFAMLERCAELNQVSFIVPETDWNGKELSTSYGRWNELKAHDQLNPALTYVMVNYASGSDYSGSLVEVANHKALIEMMSEGFEDGAEYLDYSGGHGTFGLAIRVEDMTEELIEALESIEDYPLLDEDLHSKMEMDSQWESWNDTYRSEFKTELGKALQAEFEGSRVSEQREDESDSDYESRLDSVENFFEECGEMSDSAIDDLFLKMAEYANVYWVNEQGSDCYIDVDRIVKEGLQAPRANRGAWAIDAFKEIGSMIRLGMSDLKFDLGIVRYVDPNQMSFDFITVQ